MNDQKVIPIAVTSQKLDSIVDKNRSAKQAKDMGMNWRMYRKFYGQQDDE